MDCFVGASTGALKSINFKDSLCINHNFVKDLRPKNDEISSMCWANEDESQLLIAQMDKQLKLYDTANDTFTKLFTLEKGSSPVKGIHRMKSEDVVLAAASGELLISDSEGKLLKELNAGNGLQVMVPNRERDEVYATGGRENPLKVWNMEIGQNTFVAKNIRPDSLQLRVPVWETGICFVPQSQNIVTATGLHQIRLYDPRAQRRPIKEFEWLDEPFTALSLCNKEMHVIAGNTRGEVALFDLRNKLHVVCKYKGAAGSISGLDAHSSSDYFASCSLDRFVRLYDINTKKLVKKIYCKARLNCILLNQKRALLNEDAAEKLDYEENWKKIETSKNEDDDESSDDDEDADKREASSGDEVVIWEELKQIDDKPIKRKTVDKRAVELPTKRQKLNGNIKRKLSANANENAVRKRKKKTSGANRE